MVRAKIILSTFMTAAIAATALSGCAEQTESTAETTVPATTAAAPMTNLPKTDMSKWRYDEENDLYYQTGISYCEAPADEKYEKLACFVPAAYMEATENSDGTYTCKLNDSAQINGFTASSAPIALCVNTPGYHSAEAITEDMVEMSLNFGRIGEYTAKGIVYVYPGCRGISEGAPSGVTDLKAAIRYLRYCNDVTPGDAEKIFTFGMSGGGAQSVLLGASGDSEIYAPYLEKIGAVQGVSDSVLGSASWCPVTSLDTANAEYEWMMGCTRTGRSSEEQSMSDKLAQAFAKYINSAGFVDKDGNELTLTESDEGIYQAGSYYDYVKGVIEGSLNNYLSDLSDPKAAQEYVDKMNEDKNWISYDKSTNTATITSISDFAKACKQAKDLVTGFDQPEGQNDLFGYGDGKGAHFDQILCDVLTELDSKYAADYQEDLAKKDALGYTVEQRVNMYSPLYFLMESREGYKTANVAKYWRIRSGIEQDTNSVTTEINLDLALKACDGVESVDFETIWGRNHETAERKNGDDVTSFIDWVISIGK